MPKLKDHQLLPGDKVEFVRSGHHKKLIGVVFSDDNGRLWINVNGDIFGIAGRNYTLLERENKQKND